MPTSLELAGQLREKFGDLISEPLEFRGEVTVTVANPERIAEVCLHAKTVLGFDFLIDLSSIYSINNRALLRLGNLVVIATSSN